MLPEYADEEYYIDIWRGEVLKMFKEVHVLIKVYPSLFTFELWIDGTSKFFYQKQREFYL